MDDSDHESCIMEVNEDYEVCVNGELQVVRDPRPTKPLFLTYVPSTQRIELKANVYSCCDPRVLGRLNTAQYGHENIEKYDTT